MKTNLIQPISAKHQNYLTDESKQEGYAETISFPTSEEDVQEIMQMLSDTAITYQGANTGVEGFAVPHGGHIMNFSKMNRILRIGIFSESEGYAVVEPGVSLLELAGEICRQLKGAPFFWPPSPTEGSASIGGIAATGAYGMNSCYYGSTGQYIRALSYVSKAGEICFLNRDTREASRQMDAFLASVPKPGPVTQLTLRLLKKPEAVWGVAFFFDSREAALACADELQGCRAPEDTAWFQSAEYLDKAAVMMVESGKETISKIRSIPPVPVNTEAMIIMELAGRDDDAIETFLMDVMEITERHGSDSDTAWALTGESEVEKLHNFRHAATETVVRWIEKRHLDDRRITKSGVSLWTGEDSFSRTMLALYADLEKEKLRAVIYAHIMGSDIQVNILPENYEEFRRGSVLLDHWRRVWPAMQTVEREDNR